MTLNVNSLLCRQSYACCDQTKSKVALYLSYLHIKFDDEIGSGSIWISSFISD